ncbi:MAG: DUF2254 domain-containing protein [Candidatus Binatia bacterium]
MKIRLAAVWDALRTGYWFVPSLMMVAALGLAWSTLQVDQRWAELTAKVGFFAGTPSGARSILSGVAAAMITIAGLTFSITIVAITVASQQYGARLLRTFMRDLTNQFVLGAFVAIFLYCLLVLGAIRSEDPRGYVPDLSVTLSVAFAVLGLGVLIYFIHHLSSSIDAAHLISVVGTEIDANVDALFPERLGEELEVAPAELPRGPGAGVFANASGYVQAIDEDTLLEAAGRHDAVIRLERRPGDLCIEGTRIATVWPGNDEALARSINESLVLGNQRTALQDVEFSIDQLVMIAVRALSPGVNDPFTAMLCIDRLTISLARLARRCMPRAERSDQRGALRVIARPWMFPAALDAAFNQIRQHGCANTAVTLRLLESLAVLATRVRRPLDRAAVLRQTDLIERGYASTASQPEDRADVRERALRVRRALS